MIDRMGQRWQGTDAGVMALTRPSSWLLAGAQLATASVAIVALYWPAIAPALVLWRHNNTYGYCVLILPLVALLAWRRRVRIASLTPAPTFAGVALIAVSGLVWALADLVGLVEAMQFAVVGLMQGMLLAVLGFTIYRRLWLPFACLWLLVPSGQFLVPLLQTATAAGASALLPLSGLPTYREGLVILAPLGVYQVAPGCSGLSFLLTSLVTGIIFTELYYHRRLPKLAFVTALLALAVVGNCIRVFLIIALAESVGNIGNIVDDHLIYGWGFCSMLLLGALVLGTRFHDTPPAAAPAPEHPAPGVRRHGPMVAALCALALPPLAVGAAWPGPAHGTPVAPALTCGNFAPVPAGLESPPAPMPVDGLAVVTCRRGGDTVRLVVAVLNRPVRQGKLLGLERRLADPENWTPLETTRITVPLAGQDTPAEATWLGHGDARRLVWSLFWVDGAWRAAGAEALWCDLRADLAGRRRAVLVQVSMGSVADRRAATATLGDFLAGAPLRQMLADGPGASRP